MPRIGIHADARSRRIEACLPNPQRHHGAGLFQEQGKNLEGLPLQTEPLTPPTKLERVEINLKDPETRFPYLHL